MAPAESDVCKVTVTGAAEDLTQLEQRLQGLIDDAKTIEADKIAGATREPLASALEAASPVEGKTKAELEEAISTLQAAMDAARLSMTSMTALQAAVDDATEFLDAISESSAKNTLLAVIEDGKDVYAAEVSTTDDLDVACQKLKETLSETKKTAQPVAGRSFDMTEFLANPSFESGTTGWSLDKQTTGWESFGTWNDRPAHEGAYCVSVAYESIMSLDLYQTVSGLSAGVYSVQGRVAEHRRGGLSDRPARVCPDVRRHFLTRSPWPKSAARTTTRGMTSPCPASSWPKGEALRLGVRSSGTGTRAGWFQADDFRLYYWGVNPDAVRSVQDVVDGVTVQAVEGGVRLTASSACRMPVYTLNGMLYTQWTLKRVGRPGRCRAASTW